MNIQLVLYIIPTNFSTSCCHTLFCMGIATFLAIDSLPGIIPIHIMVQINDYVLPYHHVHRQSQKELMVLQ